ncbi:integrase core domain-containing protein [Enterobacter hormaechei]|nr:integrase core domain-containing protein [Enterobacter hormaechei]SAB61249.1 integrase core domain-containing protein [Enterobacter hormaechei]SAE46979.1 integrase core domain-containing protein [Enterobacter hormaechei]
MLKGFVDLCGGRTTDELRESGGGKSPIDAVKGFFGVNAKQKCHHRCETEMSCFGSENAFDRLAIYFRAFSFPNRNHENDNFLVYNLVYKAIA